MNMVDKLPSISSLWVGSDLSWLEQVCIQSYIDNGHHFILYVIGEIKNIPTSVEIRQASEIYAPTFNISDNDRLRVAAYSDIFRFNLLKTIKTIWVDLDVYCLRSFNFPTQYVFALNSKGSALTAVMGLPSNSKALNAILEFVTMENPVQPWRGWRLRKSCAQRVSDGDTWGIEDLHWGCAGPKPFNYFLHDTGEVANALRKDVLYPLDPSELYKIHLKEFKLSEIEKEETHSLHIYGHEKKKLVNENLGLPVAGSYLDLICKRHGIDPNKAIIPRLPWM